jgi:tetratricopeptide (TPR) repeat protein
MEDATVGYAWSAALAKTGDMKQAATVLRKFESARTLPSDTQLLVGQLWTEIGDYQRAVATLHQALQQNPSLPKAHFYAGLAELRAEHWADSAKEFEAELKLAPGDLDAKYNLGFVELQQGKSADAEKLFTEVIAADSNYANAQYQLGKMLLDHGKVDEAIGHLEIAANVMPQVDYVHYQLQAAYRKDSRTADADRELEIYKKLKAREREQSSLPQRTP